MKKISTPKNKLILAALLVFALALTAAGCLQAPAENKAVSNFLGLAHPASSTPGATARNSTDATTTETIETKPDSELPDRPLESSMTIELEGMEETISLRLHQSDLNYSMYYDAERYQMLQADSQLLGLGRVDQFWPMVILDELPEIYLQIGHLDGIDIETAVALAQEQLREKYSEVRAAEITAFAEDQAEALVFSALDGYEWDSQVISVTVVDDGQNGVFVISNIYFLAAAEGHASRFMQMLETFISTP